MRLFGRASTKPLNNGVGLTLTSSTGQTVDMQVTGEDAHRLRDSIVAAVPRDASMTANAANRVKDAVERVVDKVEKAADATAMRLDGLSEKALDKFHLVEVHVADPLEKALDGLDDLLNIGSNRSPLDG